MAEPLSAKERGALGAAKRWNKDAEGNEIPRYRITAVCYHNDRIYDPESTPKDDEGEHKPLYMEFDGRPAHYMEPANDAARAMWEKYPPSAWFDPINRMTALPTDVARTVN